MSLTKLQVGLASAILAAGAGLYVVQERANAALRAELAALPQSSGEIAGLRHANRELTRAASGTADLPVSDAELVRLRDEAVALQRKLQAPAPPPAKDLFGPAGGSTLHIGELDKKPVATFRKAPLYPAELRAAGIGGRVTVSMVIDSTGKVRDVRAVESTHREFETAAIAAVSEWQFDPGLKGGRTVNTLVNQVLEFNTDSDSSTTGDWF